MCQDLDVAIPVPLIFEAFDVNVLTEICQTKK